MTLLKELKGVVISDIHFGAIPPDRLYKELEQVFFKHILQMERCDLIVIAGDLVDKKLSLNEKHSRALIKFMDTLVKIAMKKNSKVRVIRGTISHDFDQLENFYHYCLNKKVDFRIINTVTEEELFKDFKVLYIPEEYMDNKEEYYKEFIGEKYIAGPKKYKYVFGHGTFDFQAFTNQIQESEKPIKNAPVFTYDDFKDVVEGDIFFGHIHTPCRYKNIMYCGSFSRWHFGEEKKKGFIEFSYELENFNKESFEKKRIINKYARKYLTIDLTEQMNDPNITLEEKIKLIEDSKNDNKADFIRVKFDKSSLEQEGDNKVIKDFFSNKDLGVKLQISDKIKKKESEEVSEMEKEYSFIFNNEYTLEKIISTYIQKKNNIHISEDEIKEFLYEEV